MSFRAACGGLRFANPPYVLAKRGRAAPQTRSPGRAGDEESDELKIALVGRVSAKRVTRRCLSARHAASYASLPRPTCSQSAAAPRRKRDRRDEPAMTKAMN